MATHVNLPAVVVVVLCAAAALAPVWHFKLSNIETLNQTTKKIFSTFKLSFQSHVREFLDSFVRLIN